MKSKTSAMSRVGVVLAAGLGLRLASQRRGAAAKPLTTIAGVPLIIRTLHSLALAGCGRVVVVVGHRAQRVRRDIEALYHGPLRLQFAYNRQFALKNGLSVLCARPLVDGEFVLTMADHILDDEIMQRVKCNRAPVNGAALCVDFKVDSVFDLDDATKVRVVDGRIRAIGKELRDYNAIDTGVFICTSALFDALEEVYQRSGDASLSDGVARLAEAGVMHSIDIGDGFWQDVDTPEMLAHAEASLAKAAG